MAKLNKLDILAFGAHPDDVELCAFGTVLKHMEEGYKVGLIDLTRGELGTRGTPEIRLQEAAASAAIAGIAVRENLGFADGFFENNMEHLIPVIRMIRKYRPEVVLANALEDRHIDHGKAAKLVADACFLSGLVKIDTDEEGERQFPWRPRSVFHYIQDRYLKPDFVVDITPFMSKKTECILAFKSQFFNPDSDEPETPISGKEFLEFLEARAVNYGRVAGVKYAEGFNVQRTPGVPDIVKLI